MPSYNHWNTNNSHLYCHYLFQNCQCRSPGNYYNAKEFGSHILMPTFPWATMPTNYMDHHHIICHDQIVLLFYNYCLLLLIDVHLSWEICIYSNLQKLVSPDNSLFYIYYYIYMYTLSDTLVHFLLSCFIYHLLIFQSMRLSNKFRFL